VNLPAAPVCWSAVALSLVLSLAGCGVPDSGPPVVHGPADDVLDVGNGDGVPPPRPEPATKADAAVQRYFEAASSDWENLPEQVRRFLTRDTAVPTSQTILVVRDLRFGEPQVPNPENENVQRVKVSGRVTGELTRTGAMKPASGAFSHVFDVVKEKLKDENALRPPKEIWRVKNPPPQYVLSEDAVKEWYESVSLYFSNRRSTTTLIPELRYVPHVVWADGPRNLLVDWLLAGPSPWFAPVAVGGFPNGTRRLGHVVLDEGRVVVDLRGVNEQLTEIQFAQLAWTLRPLILPRRLQVRIEGRPVSYDGRQSHSPDDFGRLNGVPQGTDGAIGYYLRGGEVFRLAQEGTPQAHVGSDDDNEDDSDPPVVSAAMSRAADLAAVVREQNGRWSLWVGRRSGPSRTIRYHEVSGLPPGAIGAPEWAAGIGSAPGSFLVTVAGAVYQVEPGKRALKVVTRSVGEVDKLSVAPDGFRVAVISRGRLYLGGLVQDGDKVTLQELRPVTDQFRHAVDVAWRTEHELVVVDRGLWQVKVDGLEADKLPPRGKSPAQVAGYPIVGGKGRVLVAVDGHLYEVHSKEWSAPANYPAPPAGGSPFFGF